MRREPTTERRRIREKLRGLVSPSPVGVAIEKEVKSSPPAPSPAVLGPLATKIEQFMRCAILVMASTSLDGSPRAKNDS